jgi:hypothetical protein
MSNFFGQQVVYVQAVESQKEIMFDYTKRNALDWLKRRRVLFDLPEEACKLKKTESLDKLRRTVAFNVEKITGFRMKAIVAQQLNLLFISGG